MTQPKISKDTREYIDSLLALQTMAHITRANLELLYRNGYADRGLQAISEIRKAYKK